jgi:ketol-acid reductoisomerase
MDIKDNILEFKMKEKSEPEKEMVQETEPEKTEEESLLSMIETVQFNRQEGMRVLAESITKFEEASKKGIAASMFDIETAIDGAAQNLSGLNTLVDMVITDFKSIFSNLQRERIASFEISARLETLLDVLTKAGIISNEVMKESWENNESIKKAFAKLKEEMGPNQE